MNQTIQIQKKPESREIIVKHSYKAALQTIWDAFTVPEILEKWWAPQPYKAIVVSNNFNPGGRLHYYMLSPAGEKHYCIAEFSNINPLKSYEVLDAFCDENAEINTEFPRMTWKNEFTFKNGITEVTNTITFSKVEDMTKILEMGFEKGYTTGMNQLYALLNKE
jgi:PhnB protein